MTIESKNNAEALSAQAKPRFLRQPEVLARVGVAWITILRWEEVGLFPKRRKLGARVVAWVESEVDEWCANKASQAPGADQ